MRIVWVGNHHNQPTGYGIIAKHVIDYVHHNSRHEMVEFAVSGIQRCYPSDWNGITVYGQSNYGGKHGIGDWSTVDKMEQPDLWMVNFDAWATGDLIPKSGVKYALYPPIDHDTLAPVWKPVLNGAVDIVPYCEFGERVLREGMSPTAPISKPIPHGVDVEAYRPMEVDKKAVFGNNNVTDDTFVIGIFKNNQGTRAKYEVQLAGIEMFFDQVGHDNDIKVFLMASRVGQQSFDLQELIYKYHLQGKVMIISHDKYRYGLTPKDTAPLYNACDVVLNCVAGEGWGLPITEAFACGTPVIATAFSSMPELLSGVEGEIRKTMVDKGECIDVERGWLVPISGKEMTLGKRSSRGVFLAQDVASALIDAYNNPDKLEEKGKAAHEYAQQFAWDKVGDQWIEYFDRIEAEKCTPKTYHWAPKEETVEVGGNKTACVVFSWNRPDYLVKTLDALSKNTKADECDWFFYQDGWKNNPEYPYTNDDGEEATRLKVEQCLKILQSFPFESKEIIAREENVCIGKQLQEAKARLFQVYDHVIFFDDDHVVSEDYIDVLLKLHEQYPDAIVGAPATEARNIPNYAELDMVGVTRQIQDDKIACAGRWRWLAYLLPKAVHMNTVAEMDEYMKFIGPSYRNIPHHAVSVKYGCKITGFDGVMDTICDKKGIERVATVIPRARYIGESGLFGTPQLYAQMGFPKYDTFQFDESGVDRFRSQYDE